jgi:hypothetical protein
MRKTDNKSRSLGTLKVALAASLLLTSAAFTAAQDESRLARTVSSTLPRLTLRTIKLAKTVS